MTSLSPRPDFVALGTRISLYTPENPVTGQLIIICTWLGAAPKHIAKYTTVYQRIAPGARILLVQSAVPILISSYARQRAAIVPAVTVVLATLAECSHGPLPNANSTMTEGRGNMTLASKMSSADQSNSTSRPKILLHMFSNGGTNTATQFLLVLNERLRAPLPLSGMLYDSCPAKGTYWKDHRAMVYSLPKDFISRALGNIIIHFILVLLHTEIACGLENPSSLLRRTLLDENKVSGGADEEPSRSRGNREGGGEGGEEEGEQEGKEEGGGGEEDLAPAPKGRTAGKRSCYLYSKSDQMVDWMDIRDHAANARRNGWDVEEIMFDGSAHCGHLQKDEAKYVEAMQRMWTGKGHEDASKL